MFETRCVEPTGIQRGGRHPSPSTCSPEQRRGSSATKGGDRRRAPEALPDPPALCVPAGPSGPSVVRYAAGNAWRRSPTGIAGALSPMLNIETSLHLHPS